MRKGRLRSSADIRRTRELGARVTAQHFVLYHFARQAPERPRVGITVGARIGGAVARNRVKRRLREAIRPLVPRLAACDILVVARPPAISAGVADLERALGEAAARAGVLREDT